VTTSKPRRTPEPPPPPQATPLAEGIANFLARFQRFLWDLLGITLLALALMTLVALLFPTVSGRLLAAWGLFLYVWLGWGSFLVVVGLGILGLLVLRLRANLLEPGADPTGSPFPELRWRRVFALEAGALAFLGLLSALGGFSLERAEQGLDGGRIGWGLGEIVRLLLAALHIYSTAVASFLLGLFVLACLMAGLGLATPLRRKFNRWMQLEKVNLPEDEPAVSVAPAGDGTASISPADPRKKRQPLPAEFRKKFQVPRDEQDSGPPPARPAQLPPLELLIKETSERPDERNINQTAGMIEKTLADFGLPAKVVGFRVGPTVTQFHLQPGFLKNGETEDAAKQKVRVAQIASLRRDLALALAAERLRIETPVPGRPYIGIEVPNSRTSNVRLRPVLESEGFFKVGSPLAIALGRDVSGQPVVADLTAMPHLLIAGTTGSGKSVCIAALTTCLVMNNTPEDLRLVMIDPKMVELVRFNGLPHLYGKVETDVQRILGVLRWVTVEMDRRYKLLEAMHARHLDSYNRKVRRRKGGETLPRIVVMIDELADLMMTAPDQTEHNLTRLAQLARATGIHLVVATQRPSTDVITGLIKANFPARISFAVASSVDSRVILDTSGAEALLGHGDMLFNPPEASAPMRVQGVWVTDPEVEKVITYWQQTHPVTSEPPPWETMLEEEAMLADRDDLVKKAIQIVRGERHASASMLQRRLRIGYPRAARLMDELEELGVVGPPQSGGREREVLMSPDDASPFESATDSEDDDY
jgi:S-DNA-T family DNA segregation ATPase FtsK/SpoIIIE